MKLPKIIVLIVLLMVSKGSFASCLIIGDSIALGVSTFLPQCSSNTKIGLNTREALKRFGSSANTLTVISLGINDRNKNIQTIKNLILLRNRIKSSVVVWLIPPDLNQEYYIQNIADHFGDVTIDLNSSSFKKHISNKDHIHPDIHGYKMLALDVIYVSKHYSINI